jgi:hypothetical protein
LYLFTDVILIRKLAAEILQSLLRVRTDPVPAARIVLCVKVAFGGGFPASFCFFWNPVDSSLGAPRFHFNGY